MNKRWFFISIVAFVCFTSCTSVRYPVYEPCPYNPFMNVINTNHFGIQNLDEQATVQTDNSTCHYKDFDIRFCFVDSVVTFEIKNNTNKSMIIDKSKCYVLYDGYATPVFKDVRSSRSTTFNNVQDAINNVQTNEAGVSMTVPPYSKYRVTNAESNLNKVIFTPFLNQGPTKSYTVYDNSNNIEFIIPYSFDYSLAKWETSRNRIYISRTEISNSFSDASTCTSAYNFHKYSATNDGFTEYATAGINPEVYSVDSRNLDIKKKRLRKINTANIVFGTLTIPSIWGAIGFFLCIGDDEDYPGKYAKILLGYKYIWWSKSYEPISAYRYELSSYYSPNAEDVR